ELRDVEDRRHVAALERTQAHDWIAGERLRSRDNHLGEALTYPIAGSHQRPTCAQTGDEDVDAVEPVHDLGASSLVMRARVRLVRVLERHEVAGLAFGELER